MIGLLFWVAVNGWSWWRHASRTAGKLSVEVARGQPEAGQAAVVVEAALARVQGLDHFPLFLGWQEARVEQGHAGRDQGRAGVRGAHDGTHGHASSWPGLGVLVSSGPRLAALRDSAGSSSFAWRLPSASAAAIC